jgi:hypothetical protein
MSNKLIERAGFSTILKSGWHLSMCGISILLMLMSGCNFAPLPQGDFTPTVEEVALTLPPSPEPSLTPSVTMTPEMPAITTEPTATPLPPSETPLPSETPGPYEHVMKANETLLYIIQLYGYRDFGVIDEIVRMNDNIPNADTLPGAGSVILIPRQTATPTPENIESAPQANLGGIAPTSEQTGLNVDAPIVQYTVIQDDTIVGIAQNYATTLEVLARLNPDIPFFGCNFQIPSGGPRCNPPLQIGQVVNVPAPTPTPTLSPTPSGNETPTPTPTYAAPMVVSPPQDAQVPPVSFRLEWVSVGVLQPGEVYLVQVEDSVTGAKFNDITTSTSLRLPDTLIPSDGQAHTFNWTVTVAKPNEQGVYRIISGAPAIRRFTWQSR